MGFGVRLLVWGEYASFNRSEMKVERVSYDVMTPSAARGILEAIYWKPEIRWIVDEIHVLNSIRFTHVRRNEVKSKISADKASKAMSAGEGTLGLDVVADRAQRAAMILKDVCYGIVAHFDVLAHQGPEGKPEAKHLDQFNRRAGRGQCHHHPYLGTREFPAHFEPVVEFPACDKSLRGDKDLGMMLRDIRFVEDPKGKIVESNRGRRLRAEPRFFRAVLRDGVLRVPPLDAKEVVS